MRQHQRRHSHRSRFAFEALEVRHLLSTVVWDGGGDGRLWSNAQNWSSNVLPTAADDVVIPDVAATSTVVFDSGAGRVSVRSITAAESFLLQGGALDIARQASFSASLRMSAGVLSGAGTIQTDGSFAWSGGTISGTSPSQTMRVNGGLSIPSGFPTLDGRRLELDSDTSWTGGEIRMLGGAELHNLAGRTFDVGGDLVINDLGTSTTETWVNAGTLRKSAGNQQAVIKADLNNLAGGTVWVQQGTLTLTGASTNAGHWQLDNQAMVRLQANTHAFHTGTSSAGTGQVWVDNATFEAVDTVNWNAGFRMTGGQQTGAGQLNLNGPVAWDGGQMTGTDPAQITRITGGLAVTGGFPTLSGRRLELDSDTSWTGGEIRMLGGAELHNLAGRTFDVGGDLVINDLGTSTTETWVNAGTLRKSAGNQQAVIKADLNNLAGGTVWVQQGTLTLTGASTNAGHWQLDNQAVVRLQANTHAFHTGTSSAGTGQVWVDNATFEAVDTVNWNAGFRMTGGQQTGAGQLNLNGPVAWDGGQMTGTGPAQITRITGGLAITGGFPTLSGRRLELDSDTSWTGGEIRMLGGAELHNLAGRTFDVGGDLVINDLGTSTTETWVNAGTLRKSAGNQQAVIKADLNNLAGGTVWVQQGTLTLTGASTNAGHWQLDNQAVVRLQANTHAFHTGTSSAGTGQVWVDNATFEAVDTVNWNAGFRMTGGQQTGAGQLNLNGPVAWDGGQMTGTDPAQITRITGGLAITGGFPTLSGRRLELDSDTSWTGGEIRMLGGAELHNLAGRTFDIGRDLVINDLGTTTTETWVNAGTLRKSAGNQQAVIKTDLNNLAGGTVWVQQGTLTLTGASTNAGHWQLDNQAVVRLQANTHAFHTGTSSAGTGQVWVDNATFEAVDTVNWNAGFRMTGGQQTGAGQLNLNGPVAWDGGQMTGTGPAQVTRITGGLAITGGFPTLSGRRLELDSDTSWTGGEIRVAAAAQIDNLPGHVFLVANNLVLNDIDPSTVSTFLNRGELRRDGGTSNSVIKADFVNQGDVSLLTGTLVADRFRQTSGRTWLGGNTLQSSVPVEILGGILYGPGNFVGDVVNQATVVLHDGPAAGQVTISKSYQQTSSGRVEVQLLGPSIPEQDRLVVGQAATLNGTLRISDSASYTPPLGFTFTPIGYASRTGAFSSVVATVGSNQSVDVQYTASNVTAQVIAGPPTNQPDTTRQLLNAGLDEIRTWIQQWVTGFDLGGARLPFVNETITSIFALPGTLTNLAAQKLQDITTQVNQYAVLRQVLENAGLTVVCVSGEASCDTAGEQLRAQWNYQTATQNPPAPLSSVATMDDTTPGLLDGVSSPGSFAVNGQLSATTDLDLSLTFGVDDSGFFLSGGGSQLSLPNLMIQGTASGSGIAAGQTNVSLQAQLSSNVDVGLVLGTTGAKYRSLDQLPLGSTVAGPGGTGGTDVSIAFQMGPAALSWQGHFTSSKSAAGTLQVALTTAHVTADLQLADLQQTNTANGVSANATYQLQGDCANQLCLVTGQAAAGFDYDWLGFELRNSVFDLTLGPSTFAGVVSGTMVVDLGNPATGQDEITIPFQSSFDAYQLHIDAEVIPPATLRLGSPAALELINPRVMVDIDQDFAQPAANSFVVTAEADQATMFPTQSIHGTIADDDPVDALPGITATLDARQRRVTAQLRELTANAGTDVQLVTGPLTFNLGLNDAANTPLLQGQAAKLLLAGIDASSSLQVSLSDFSLTRGGTFQFGGASLIAAQGILGSFGLSGILPFDVTEVHVESTNNAPITLNNFLADIRVVGAFDFSLWTAAGLPQPTVQVGNQPPNQFEVTFRVAQQQILVWQTGPIVVGFANLDLTAIQVGLSLTLNGYSQGLLDSGFAIEGDLSLADGTPLGSISTLGNLQLTASQATLDATTSVTVSQAFGVTGVADFQGLTAQLHTRIVANSSTGQLVQAEARLLGAQLAWAEFHLGSVVTLRGTQVAVDFQPSPGQPFIQFGGNPTTLLGGIELVFAGGEAGGPLDGLGGQAGNFGIAWDPTSLVGLQLVPLQNFYFQVIVPTGFKFGLPDWVPLDVREIGLAFGQLAFDPLALPTQLADLTDISLIVSGGLTGNANWPITAQFEDLRINFQKLTACGQYIATNPGGLIPNGGTTLDGFAVAGLELLQHCAFPIENLDAIEMAIEPFDLGGVRIGGGLGFGMLDVDLDTNHDGIADRQQSVLYGRVLGELEFSEVGVGVELILTEYGPILARLSAGVPVPIGGLIGAVVGVFFFGVGAAAGYQVGDNTGFIVSGFEGGLVFGEDPLPVITDPAQILEGTIHDPLDITLTNVLGKLQQVAQDRYDVLHDNDPLNDAPVYTWSDGFTLAFSGVLTNRYVNGLIALEGTFGINVGYGSPAQTGIQLFGYGDLELSGIDLARSGVLLDVHLDDPLSPTLNAAFSFPGGQNNPLRLLFPATGDFAVRVETTGLFQGAVAGLRALLDGIAKSSLQVGGALFAEMASRVAQKLEQSRQAWLAAAPGSEPPLPRLLRYLLALNDSATITANQLSQPMTQSRMLFLARARLRTTSQLAASSATSLTRAAFLAEALLNEMVDSGTELLRQADNGQVSDPTILAEISSLQNDPAIAGVLQTVLDKLNPFVPVQFLVPPPPVAGSNDLWPSLPGAQQTAEELADTAALANRLYALLVSNIQNTLLNSAAQFYAVIDPSLTFTGALQPTIVGIPIGQPISQVGGRLDKGGLQFSADTTVGQLLNAAGVVAQVLGGPDIPIGTTVSLPIGNQLMAAMFQDQPFSPVSTNDANWSVQMTTGLKVAYFDLATIQALVVPPVAPGGPANPAWQQQIQKVWLAPNLPLDPNQIPVFDATRFQALSDYGGVLASGYLQIPRLLTDPTQMLSSLPPPPTDALSYFSWLGQVAQTLQQVDIPGQFQAFLPAMTTALKVPVPPGLEPCDVLNHPAGCVVDPAQRDAIWASAFLEGSYNGKLLGLEVAKAQVEGELNGQGLPILSVVATDPWLGADLRLEIGSERRNLPTGPGTIAQVDFPIASGQLTLSASQAVSLIQQLPIPTDFLPPSLITNGSGAIRAFSPGYSQNAGDIDRLKVLGGVAFQGQFNADVFGVLTGQFQGSVDTTGAMQFDASNVTLNFAAPPGFGLPLGGQIQGQADLSFSRSDLLSPVQTAGDFAGSFQIAGQRAVAVDGQIDAQGCLSGTVQLLTLNQPFEYEIVPGACVPHVSVLDQTIDEGNATQPAQVVVELSRPWPTSSKIDVTVFYEVGTLPAGASVARASATDFIESYGSIRIPAGQTSASVPITVLGDSEWEADEAFRVTIVSAVSASIADDTATVTLRDDDLAGVLTNVFSALQPAPDTLVAYDFQSSLSTFQPTPTLTAPEFIAAGPLSHSRTLTSASGLPDANGNGLAGLGQNWQANDYFQFSVDLGDSGLLATDRDPVDATLTGLRFWDRPHTAGQAWQTWQVEAFVNGQWYPLTLESQLIVDDAFFAAQSLPPNSALAPLIGWRRNQFGFDAIPQLGYLLPGDQPAQVQIRIQGLSSIPTRIDKLELHGQVIDPCEDANDIRCSQSVPGNILKYLDERGRPVRIDVLGPGVVEGILSPPTDLTNPSPQDLLSLRFSGTDPTRTRVVVRWDNGAVVTDRSPVDLGHVSSAGGLLELEMSGVDAVAGQFDMRGNVGVIRTRSIESGSTFNINGSPRDGMTFIASGIVGNTTGRGGVDLSYAGSATVSATGWYGGTWQLGSFDRVTISGGDFSPNVYLQSGFNSIQITGGDIQSARFETGRSAGVGDGSGQLIRATADARGTGGSIQVGSLQIDGDLDTLESVGGTIQANVFANRVTTVQASIHNSTARGGDIQGTLDVFSLNQMTSLGGTISATLITRDPLHSNLAITAQPFANQGGAINSGHSFHIAGGVDRLVAHDAVLRLETGRPIGSILITPSLDGRAGQLTGSITAPRLNQLVVAQGTIDFVLHITQPDGPNQPAIGAIVVPDPTQLQGRLQLAPQATVGSISDINNLPLLTGDLNTDGRLNSDDIDLLCGQLGSDDARYDLNRDNRVDELDTRFLIENLWQTVPGDANLDGIFNSQDLVQVFQSGEYEDGASGNSSWSDGDWNCDGEFDSSDLVAAFQRGGYVAFATPSPRPALAVFDGMLAAWPDDRLTNSPRRAGPRPLIAKTIAP